MRTPPAVAHAGGSAHTEQTAARAPETSRDRAAGSSTLPFKQIDCADIRRLCLELSPAALKVWMYHWGLTNRNDSSYAKLERIAAETGLHLFTVKIARGWLRDNGWLDLVGYKKFGGKRLPELRCVVPGPMVQKPPSSGLARVQKPPSLGSRRLKKTPWSRVQKPPTEVDLNLEVDKEREVQAPNQFTFATMQTPVLPIESREPVLHDAVALWSEIRASVRRRVNPHSFETWFMPITAESIAGDRLTLNIPRPMWVKRLQETYGGVLREALAEIKRPELTLGFISRESC